MPLKRVPGGISLQIVSLQHLSSSTTAWSFDGRSHRRSTADRESPRGAEGTRSLRTGNGLLKVISWYRIGRYIQFVARVPSFRIYALAKPRSYGAFDDSVAEYCSKRMSPSNLTEVLPR